MSKRLEVKTGDRYGRLTILKEVEPYVSPSGSKARKFLCQCDCNSEPFEVLLNSLRNGDTKSCGCVRKEKAKEVGSANSKINEYDLSDNKVGIGYTSNGEKFMFDKEDFELIKDYCWCTDKYGYITSKDRITRKTVYFHRLVMHPEKDEDVDHINRNKLDNRKANLRVCKHVDNAKNKGIYKKNTSGFTGITWNKKTSKWQAQISVNGRNTHLGYFASKAEAIRARIKAELEIQKEYSTNYFKFTPKQKQAILNNEMPSEEIVKILNQKVLTR